MTMRCTAMEVARTHHDVIDIDTDISDNEFGYWTLATRRDDQERGTVQVDRHPTGTHYIGRVKQIEKIIEMGNKKLFERTDILPAITTPGRPRISDTPSTLEGEPPVPEETDADRQLANVRQRSGQP